MDGHGVAGNPPTDVEVTTRWPPYALPNGSPLRDALLKGAIRAEPRPAKIAGPSNIGNYLAGLGIPATAGFGVDYKGLHGTDERIRLDSIPAIQAAYHHAPSSPSALRLTGCGTSAASSRSSDNGLPKHPLAAADPGLDRRQPLARLADDRSW